MAASELREETQAMVDGGHGWSRPVPGRAGSTRAALLAVMIVMVRVASAGAADDSIFLSEAAEKGTFNVGPARAVVRFSTDPSGAGALSLEYTIPPGAAAGLYAKAFPGGLSADRVDAMRLAVKAADPRQAERIAVAVEIKGTAGVQRIPVEVQFGWAPIEVIVDWPRIGMLREVVVSVSPSGGGETVSGTIAIDARFERFPILRRLSVSPVARIGGVFLASLTLALLSAGLRRVTGRWSRREEAPPAASEERSTTQRPRARSNGIGLLGGDLIRGAGTVFLAVLVIEIAHLGETGPLEAGWTALGLALAGAGVAEWWKSGLTGRHLTPGEVFQDMVATGLLAASSSAVAILQAPAAWSDLLLLSQVAAATFTLVYHGVNAARLAGSGRHLGGAGAALIVGTPYIVGGLTLLEATGLLQALGGVLTLAAPGEWAAVREYLGRALVLFAFNAAVAHGLSLVTSRTPLKCLRAHLVMAAVAAGAAAAPGIAGLGSGATVAAWPALPRVIATVLATIGSQAGLWGEAYLITGMAMDAIHGQAPTRVSVAGHPIRGMTKGMVYSGTFMAVIQVLGALGSVPGLRWAAERQPWLAATLFGAIAFPLVKTIIETFDGSQAFFRRARRSYASPVLSLRGMVIGLGLGYGLTAAMAGQELAVRAGFGFLVGALAFAGIDLLRDSLASARGRGRVQPSRSYLAHALLGGFIGAAVGFYLDAAQVAVVAAKFHRYLAAGLAPEPYDIYPLVSKWGHLHLGVVTGGVSLLFAEALAGVISWSTAAWLFAINRTFLTAYFQRETTPIRTFFTRDGLVQLGENMIVVLRWGLWMSPIINSFLRPMGEPTWYNQDGAVRTAMAIVHDATSTPDAFRAWSLQVFIALLAYDSVRILIWLDHMGLRVATLVNLSFLGVDKLEQRLARLLAPAATARCIPEGVKRFTTWGPLLIPYYIPRGRDWDQAWSQAEAIRSQEHGGLLATLHALPVPAQTLLLAGAIAAATAAAASIRWLKWRFGARALSTLSLSHAAYAVTLREDGAVVSQVPGRGYDVSRRSYDLLDPAGRALFLVEAPDLVGRPSVGPSAGSGDPPRTRVWPVIGNLPSRLAGQVCHGRDGNSLKVIHHSAEGLLTTVAIALPDDDAPVELWTITVENRTESPRTIKLVPYLEWVLNGPEADRGHTQYNRLFAEMEYRTGLHAVLAWDRHSRALGLLASDRAPEGFLTSRIDFIGRARSLGSPRVLETLAFAEAQDTAAHPTFDPIGSLLITMAVPARASSQVRLLIGMTGDQARAIDLIARHLRLPEARSVPPERKRAGLHPIGHGEIPPGTPQPYCEFAEDGRRLMIHTPFTPRPYDHTLSNSRGHVVVVTNRGLHTSSSVNSQQNRLTPDWSDTVTREVPGEAIYLYDPDAGEWFAPTYHPLNDAGAEYRVEFGVDGTATFRMTRGTIETELTVFVPPEDPTGIYLLTVRNHADVPRRLRLVPYFQMVLAGQPEHSGPLRIRGSGARNARFFENPRNTFRTGPAFVGMSDSVDRWETRRGRFFGSRRDLAHPSLVERGQPERCATPDDRPIAAMLTTIEIPAHGEHTTVVVLGQADDLEEAQAVIRKYQDLDAARAALQETRRSWLDRMDSLRVETDTPEFDHYLDWLKYQALAERIWARRGFYQASGAFGFRDQLQDAVNLIAMDPALARRQILLHAAQQFTEGDVVHWFHRLSDGRTGFVGRTHASDNLLWLAWGVVEYLQATGDRSILEERVPYLESEQPFEPLPAGKHGIGFDPIRSTREDTVYRHCLQAIDLVLHHRMGAHGLPLMGTGDWNDGLDEIGSQGRGESVWLGFFLSWILDRLAGIVGRQEGPARQEYYLGHLGALQDALERTWRGDRYLRAIHDDGTEIGVEGSGVWEIDALSAAWAVMSGINPKRGRVVFKTALGLLEQETTILLGWPPLREEIKPSLGRSSVYPEGVRENGMYCHGVQWLVGAARILADRAGGDGRPDEARTDLETAYRLWRKISAIPHVKPDAVETYGGQPNQQAADMVTTFDPGRMIWNGYTGAAGWMFRQALEGVLGLRLVGGQLVPRPGVEPAGSWPVLVRATRRNFPIPIPAPDERPHDQGPGNRRDEDQPDEFDLEATRSRPGAETGSHRPPELRAGRVPGDGW